MRRGGAPADPIENAEAAPAAPAAPADPIGNVARRQEYFNRLKLDEEKKAFKKQIEKIGAEQAGIPRINELKELLRMFHQATELIKHEAMRNQVSIKLNELEKYELYGEFKNKLQTFIGQMQERIEDYEARI